MSFWNYSNTIYSLDGVPRACLNLQDGYGLDVNMVLFCCWYGITYAEIDEKLFSHCLNYSHHWTEKTVKPIRNVRIWLKTSAYSEYSDDTDICMNYREKIKKVELEAEKIQQFTLESFCKGKEILMLSHEEKIGAASTNLKRYTDAKNLESSNSLNKELDFIIQASCQSGEIA
jgi:uncharacterized protein (TIGR02444 family)